MLFNIVLGGAIFGYASWTVIKFIKKSKKGKCAACSLSKQCSTTSCLTPEP